MRWTAEVADGGWLAPRLDDPWQGTIHDVVPRGFAAYARVLHPGRRSRPVGRPWPPLPHERHRTEWESFAQAAPQLSTEPVTWAQTAAALGTRLAADTSWETLVAPGILDAAASPRDLDGWDYDDPTLGGLDPEPLAALARVLATATTTPDDGHLALWEGWGGLVGHLGPTPSRAFLQLGADPGHNRMLGEAVPDRFRSPFAQERWQPGILPDEVSRGPRLRLPHRDHLLFTAGVRELTSPSWVLAAPWRDREAEAHGFGPAAQSPSLLWPADRAWVMVSEIDWDSTVVAGSETLVAAVCAEPGLEAFPLAADAVLTHG